MELHSAVAALLIAVRGAASVVCGGGGFQNERVKTCSTCVIVKRSAIPTANGNGIATLSPINAGCPKSDKCH
jgi:hypothetical protein